MGFFGNLWSALKSGVKTIGDVVSNPQTWKKVGDIGSRVVDVAKTLSPILGNVPVVGNIIKGVAGAGGLVDLAKRAGEGDLEGAAIKGLEMLAPKIPALTGKANRILEPIFGSGRKSMLSF